MSETLVFLVGVALGGSAAAAWFLARRAALAADAARLERDLAAARQDLEDERARFADVEAQMSDRFTALSHDALRDNRADFLQHAESLLAPMRETLRRVEDQLTTVDKEREGSFRAVASQLQSLASSQTELRAATEGLSRSLRSPNVRGKWGEVQLRRIVELAGMLNQCDFAEKVSVTSDDGSRLTPDLVVYLPGGSRVVVDAKVPIDAYLESTTAKTDAEREARLAAHARQVRDHVKALGAKEYWRQFDPAPDFVVMFLPLEPLLGAAFEEDGSLLEQAANARVIPATPMTLLALLKAIASGWTQQAVWQNAEEIRSTGRQLYERLSTVVQHVDRLGASLRQAGGHFNDFIGSLERSVLPGARRFKELGVSATKEIPDVDPIDLAIRPVTRDELTAPIEQEPTGRPS